MSPVPNNAGAPVRCAVYTRKSSDEGLEQSFNSLDAQREACAAYILSQASEGWSLLPDLYDDGGISGGTLERPALQRLLAEVLAGRIDIIVVYKVDRLSRSLLDFAKLVEAFDKANTSFVSITQSFNTTTSMGRLTLNMLLSFAQFEREVTAERIRDKIAASKAKGMWMGGNPPLGYRPDARSLAIVPEHAELVRDIFRRYLDLGNVRLLQRQLIDDGIHAPRRSTATGKPIGGAPFSRGQLYHLLKNRIYLGEIVHKDKTWPGLHAPILSSDIWDRTQALLAANLQGHAAGLRTRSPSLLAGLIVDEQGQPLIASHASKPVPSAVEGGTTRYRYYVSRELVRAGSDAGLRIPAREIETAICQGLADAFSPAHRLIDRGWLRVAVSDYAMATARIDEIVARIRQREHKLVRDIVTRIRVEPGRILIACDTSAIAATLKLDIETDAPAEMQLELAVRLRRSGHVMRLVHDSGARSTIVPEASMARLLARGHQLWAELREGELDVTALARREGVCTSYISRVVRLAFLSPAVTRAILAGTQRDGVDTFTLTTPGAIDTCWRAQGAKLLPGMDALPPSPTAA